MTDEVQPKFDKLGDQQQLEEGYHHFREWAEAMARSGQPLPPGGVCVVNRGSTLTRCVLMLQRSVAAELKMPLEYVKINVERNEITGALHPSIDVQIPEGWINQTYYAGQSPGGSRAEEFAHTYVRATLGRLYEQFRVDYLERIEALDKSSRTDLAPAEIEDLVGQAAQETHAETGSGAIG